MSSGSETFYTNTEVLLVKDLHNGKYTVGVVESDPVPPPPDLHSGNRKELELPTGVPGLTLHGYYDPDSQEVGLYVTFWGVPIGGKYSANIKDGLTVNIDVTLLKGWLRIYKKGNELRFGWDLTVGFDGLKKHFKGDILLFKI